MDNALLWFLAHFKTMLVWPHEKEQIEAVMRLEQKGLISVRRIKTPKTCILIVTKKDE